MNEFKIKPISETLMYKFKKGSLAMKALRNIHSDYGNEAVQTWQWWFGQFHLRNFSFKDLPLSGWPNSVNTELLQTTIEENPKQTTWKLAKHKVDVQLLNTFIKSIKYLNLISGSLIIWLLLDLIKELPSLCHWRINWTFPA